MTDRTKKNEGPSCACGKTDLYEEFLKNQQKDKEVSNTTTSDKDKDNKNSTDAEGKKNYIKLQIK